MWAASHMSGVSLEICSSLESIYPGQNTEGAAVSRTGHMLLDWSCLRLCCLMLVILTATGASVPVLGLIWAMTLRPSPSNTSLTRQLGLCSTGGNRLGDWRRGGCENISLNTFSRNTKTAIPSDGIAFSLNSRQPWECGCKEFPLHSPLSALSRAYNGSSTLLRSQFQNSQIDI